MGEPTEGQFLEGIEQPEYDTPESVREKLRNVPVILNMANHYLVERHDGDFYGCDRCFDKRGEEESPPF